jgi:hypothetical protein
LPNDTTPGTVTQEDYAVWRANYGTSGTGSLIAGGGSASAQFAENSPNLAAIDSLSAPSYRSLSSLEQYPTNVAHAGASKAARPILPQPTSATRGTDLIFALLSGDTATGADNASTIGKSSARATAEAPQGDDVRTEIFGISDMHRATRL